MVESNHQILDCRTGSHNLVPFPISLNLQFPFCTSALDLPLYVSIPTVLFSASESHVKHASDAKTVACCVDSKGSTPSLWVSSCSTESVMLRQHYAHLTAHFTHRNSILAASLVRPCNHHCYSRTPIQSIPHSYPSDPPLPTHHHLLHPLHQ